MLLSIVLPVRLDLLHPRWACAGVQHCDDDDGRAAPDGDFGDVGQGRRAGRAAYYTQQPEQCDEAQDRASDHTGSAAQQASERRRYKGCGLVVARGVGRRPRRLARRHGEVHGESVGPRGQVWAVGGQMRVAVGFESEIGLGYEAMSEGRLRIVERSSDQLSWGRLNDSDTDRDKL